MLTRDGTTKPVANWDFVQSGRPGGSDCNLDIFWRWDVSSNLGAVTRTGIFPHRNKNNKITKITSNKWRTIRSLVHKIRLHGRRGKGTAGSLSVVIKIKASTAEGRWRNPVWPSSTCIPVHLYRYYYILLTLCHCHGGNLLNSMSCWAFVPTADVPILMCQYISLGRCGNFFMLENDHIRL